MTSELYVVATDTALLCSTTQDYDLVMYVTYDSEVVLHSNMINF